MEFKALFAHIARCADVLTNSKRCADDTHARPQTRRFEAVADDCTNESEREQKKAEAIPRESLTNGRDGRGLPGVVESTACRERLGELS